MQRRTFLRLLAASSAVPLVPACTDAEVFLQGVASGDPSPDGVLLWTRVEGMTEVDYVVATDRELRNVVRRGTATVDADGDGTVHVEVTGLSAATVYWYRFSGGGTTSQVGRTKTAPLPDADVSVRIAVASCQDFGGRWFHAWQSLALRDDIDVVLFIGDYIYETIGHLDAKLPAGRTPTIPDGLPLEDPLKGQVAALTLADYRALYRQYRRDPDLQAVHARFPFVMLWDDHEFANDCWGDHATDFDDLYGDEASPERRAAATQAWFEYSPIRKRESIFRSFRWGRHADFVLIDERSYRDDIIVPEGPIDREVGHIMTNSAFGARTFVIKDAFDAREATKQPTMLGKQQREWAISTLTSSTATWKLLMSPLVMTQMVVDLTAFDQLPDTFRERYYFKTDQWDGYRSERRALLEATQSVDNLVVLSGDLHGFYAAELQLDPDHPGEPVCVEYAVSAVSAPTVDAQLYGVIEGNIFLKGLGVADLVPQFDDNLRASNPEIVHADSTHNGVALVDITAQAIEVQFIRTSDVTMPNGRETDVVKFRTRLGSRRASSG
jgi:alkaline phosphatase D